MLFDKTMYWIGGLVLFFFIFSVRKICASQQMYMCRTNTLAVEALLLRIISFRYTCTCILYVYVNKSSTRMRCRPSKIGIYIHM